MNNVRLLTTSFDESFRFWRDTMGFEVSWGKEGDTYAHFEVANVDESHAALVKKGITFLRPPTDRQGWGIRTAYLRDPDGKLIEIMTSLQN